MSDENKKITYTESLQLLRKSIVKGIQRGEDIVKTREAQRLVIAYRIKMERQAADITVKELCDKINANELTYRNYESCKSDVPIMYLVRIADVLNLSLDYVTGRTDNKEDSINQTESIEERVKRLEEIILK